MWRRKLQYPYNLLFMRERRHTEKLLDDDVYRPGLTSKSDREVLVGREEHSAGWSKP